MNRSLTVCYAKLGFLSKPARLVSVGLFASSAGCVTRPATPPAIYSKATTGIFSLARYRSLDVRQRQSMLRDVERGACSAKDVDLVDAYSGETIPARRLDLAYILARRHTPDRDRAVIGKLWPWNGRTSKSEIAIALNAPKSSKARDVLRSLAKDRDPNVWLPAKRSLYGRDDPKDIELLNRNRTPPGAVR